MDRLIVDPYEVVNDTDLLNSERNTIIAIGNILDAVVGEGFVSNNLTCTESSVPNMNVNVSASTLSVLSTVDPVAYGSLGIDSDPLVKQGINSDATVIPLTAPATAGNAINYLIQAQVTEADTDLQSRSFFNGAALPPQTIATRRADTVTFQAVAGTSAPIGTQATPTPTSGWCGCFVVTVEQGQTSIVDADIVRYTSTGAVVFLDDKLQDKLSLTQANALYVPLANSTNFRVNLSTDQTIPSATQTKLALNTTSYNVNSGYNTSTQKFQPTIAGYYSVTASLSYPAPVTNFGADIKIYKNGAESAGCAFVVSNTLTANVINVTDIIFLNGSTDYLEVYTYQDSAGTQNVDSDSFLTYFVGFKTP